MSQRVNRIFIKFEYVDNQTRTATTLKFINKAKATTTIIKTNESSNTNTIVAVIEFQLFISKLFSSFKTYTRVVEQKKIQRKKKEKLERNIGNENGITDIIRSQSTDYFSGVKDLTDLEVPSSLVNSSFHNKECHFCIESVYCCHGQSF